MSAVKKSSLDTVELLKDPFHNDFSRALPTFTKEEKEVKAADNLDELILNQESKVEQMEAPALQITSPKSVEEDPELIFGTEEELQRETGEAKEKEKEAEKSRLRHKLSPPARNIECQAEELILRPSALEEPASKGFVEIHLIQEDMFDDMEFDRSDEEGSPEH